MTLLLAKISDLASIEALMKRSMQILGIGHYSPEQIDACSQFVCVPDKQLVEDQTYYVMEENGILIGCGGWSFRNKLYAGPADTPQKSDRLYCEAVNFFILTCVKAPGFVYQKEGSIINTASFLIDEPRGFDAGQNEKIHRPTVYIPRKIPHGSGPCLSIRSIAAKASVPKF